MEICIGVSFSNGSMCTCWYVSLFKMYIVPVVTPTAKYDLLEQIQVPLTRPVINGVLITWKLNIWTLCAVWETKRVRSNTRTFFSIDPHWNKWVNFAWRLSRCPANKVIVQHQISIRTIVKILDGSQNRFLYIHFSSFHLPFPTF